MHFPAALNLKRFENHSTAQPGNFHLVLFLLPFTPSALSTHPYFDQFLQSGLLIALLCLSALCVAHSFLSFSDLTVPEEYYPRQPHETDVMTWWRLPDSFLAYHGLEPNARLHILGSLSSCHHLGQSTRR